jgi:hypothetical protein
MPQHHTVNVQRILQLVIEKATELAGNQNRKLYVSRESKWREDLKFDNYDLGDIFMHIHSNTALIPDINTLLPLLINEENMNLQELSIIIHENIVTEEEFRKLNKTSLF